jgi:hypothetical protein
MRRRDAPCSGRSRACGATEGAAILLEVVKLAMLPISNPPSPAALKDFVKSEIARRGKVARRAGLWVTRQDRPCSGAIASIGKARRSPPRARIAERWQSG